MSKFLVSIFLSADTLVEAQSLDEAKYQVKKALREHRLPLNLEQASIRAINLEAIPSLETS